jgi:hypothetical protein
MENMFSPDYGNVNCVLNLINSAVTLDVDERDNGPSCNVSCHDAWENGLAKADSRELKASSPQAKKSSRVKVRPGCHDHSNGLKSPPYLATV